MPPCLSPEHSSPAALPSIVGAADSDFTLARAYLIVGNDLLDVDQLSVARAAIAHRRGMAFLGHAHRPGHRGTAATDPAALLRAFPDAVFACSAMTSAVSS